MRVNSQQNRKGLGRSYIDRSEVSSGMPVVLTVESTSICNLKCIMCPYPSMGRKNEHMSMTVYEKIVEEGAGFVEFMWLHLFGEPLINPDIYKMIDMAEDAGIRTGISTNATRLDEKASAALLDSKLSLLLLCLDGATKQTFEKIRVGAKFEKVHRNIARFAEMKCARNSELKASLQMIHMTDTQNEKQRFEEEWRDKGFDTIIYKPFNYWANQDSSLIQIGEPSPPRRSGACSEPWIGFTVLADGTVTPCCNDYAGKMPLGDLKTQSLREVWNGPEMMRLRRRFAGDVPDLGGTICQDCPFPIISTGEAEMGAGGFNAAESRLSEYLGTVQEMPRLDPSDPHLVTTTISLFPDRVRSAEAIACEVKIANRSPWTLRSTGSTPIHLSYHWLDTNGSYIVFDGLRTRLLPELPSGRERTYHADVIAPDVPGKFVLQVSLVQEQVAWFENWDPRNSDTRTIEVQGSLGSEKSSTQSLPPPPYAFPDLPPSNGTGLRATLARVFGRSGA